MNKCPRCLNEDPKYFYNGSKGVYCRKCVSFKRVLLNEEEAEKEPYYTETEDKDADYQLSFELTSQQKDISQKLCEYSDKEDLLVWAACGTGKTEIVMEVIRQHVVRKEKVGFAIPRRQVVIEIAERLEKAFPHLEIACVCQGYHDKTEGDIIVCTTHQLYRYSRYFDLLILDEPDAFPYKGNTVLHGIVQTACKGHKIALSATPDDSLKQLRTFTLFKRHHGYPLAVPKIVLLPQTLCWIYLFFWLKKRKRVLIFVPTIKMAELLAGLFHTACFTSQTIDKEKTVSDFRENKIRYLFCTTILERGVTFSNIQVAILNAEHSVFDKASLIQIAGRVGRDKNYPTGDVLFLCTRKSEEVSAARKEILWMNA